MLVKLKPGVYSRGFFQQTRWEAFFRMTFGMENFIRAECRWSWKSFFLPNTVHWQLLSWRTKVGGIDPWCQFYQRFTRSYYARRSWKRKKIQLSHQYLFTLSESVLYVECWWNWALFSFRPTPFPAPSATSAVCLTAWGATQKTEKLFLPKLAHYKNSRKQADKMLRPERE